MTAGGQIIGWGAVAAISIGAVLGYERFRKWLDCRKWDREVLHADDEPGPDALMVRIPPRWGK